ncbi:MAG: bifunctional adenosylcobinamide kinase/adenosylcobinamide-phosphate guanylyltransferase [Pseudomonadota bacterium]
MKSLFIGGVKSGKSLLAEQYTKDLCTAKKLTKPVYLATSEFTDSEMLKRISLHQEQRKNLFITIEEPVAIVQTISQLEPNQVILIECITMWLNNMLYHNYSHSYIYEQLQLLLKLPQQLVFVLNDVGGGIIPDNALAREFIDLSGKSSQLLAVGCQQVFFCIAGIKQQLKPSLPVC